MPTAHSVTEWADTSLRIMRRRRPFSFAYQLDSSFVLSLLYASLALRNAGDWARADSLLSIVDRRREQLTAYDRAWLDYRIAFVRGKPEQELAAIRDAARLAPGSKAVYDHAVTAFQTGHVHEALAAIRALSPDRGVMRGFIRTGRSTAQCCMRWANTRQSWRQASRRAPNIPIVSWRLSPWCLARSDRRHGGFVASR